MVVLTFIFYLINLFLVTAANHKKPVNLRKFCRINFSYTSFKIAVHLDIRRKQGAIIEILVTVNI